MRWQGWREEGGGLGNSIWCTPGILAAATVIRCRHLVVAKLLFSRLGGSFHVYVIAAAMHCESHHL